MKCHSCNSTINERPWKDSQCYCPQCGAHSGIVPLSIRSPKRGESFKWSDCSWPMTVDNVDGLFVWVWQAGNLGKRAIDIAEWKNNVAHGDLIPF